MDKRAFLKNLALSSIATASYFKSIANSLEHFENDKIALSENNAFWEKIRDQYVSKEDYINLEGGYYCMLPQQTLDRHKRHIDMVNKEASYYMRTVQWENKQRIASKLATWLDTQRKN